MYEIVGEKEVYTLEDAQSLQKRQYKIQEYRNKMDLEFGYSPEKMLLVLKDRCHFSYQLSVHAQYLRELVTETIQENTLPLDLFKNQKKINYSP